jgi:hypothetical protein
VVARLNLLARCHPKQGGRNAKGGPRHFESLIVDKLYGASVTALGSSAKGFEASQALFQAPVKARSCWYY